MNYTITVTGEELILIGQALDELPAKVSRPLINKLQAQADEQGAKIKADATAANRAAVLESLTDEEIAKILGKKEEPTTTESAETSPEPPPQV